MGFYIQVDMKGDACGVWEIDPTHARRIDGANASLEATQGLDALTCLRNGWPATEVHELKLVPGSYYRRMSRPSSSHPKESPGYNPDNLTNHNLIETSRGQLSALREQLKRICRVVHPSDKTFKTFGHDIRNLLILACTEVEAHFKGVLKANGCSADGTKDYVKLSPAMKLGEYAINFPFYPWLPPMRPFENWKLSATPTKDLKWYDAYNAVKHDRETQFELSTLENAFLAVSGVVVMMAAQFGWVYGLRQRSSLTDFFELNVAPNWHPSDVYTHVRTGETGVGFTTPIDHSF
jgi:hypothetical protein